jgi:hypothetical protein
MSEVTPGVLPYHDAKGVGAADFYFAINATFRFIQAKLGPEALRRYWRELGTGYYAPVSAAWRRGGLPAVGIYWREFFLAEPASAVQVTTAQDCVTVEVHSCPAFRHLRAAGREIFPCFCEHCYYVSEAIAAPAGFTVRVQGGNGACVQRFMPQNPNLPAQDLNHIKEAT